jgi:hypothetical protein
LDFILKYRTLVLVVLALNVVGAVLVLFWPFGGMLVTTAYGPAERFAGLGRGYNEGLDLVLVILIGASLIVSALLSFILFNTMGSDQRRTIKVATVVAVVTLLLTIIAGVQFNIVRSGSDYYLDWWLDTGFYAGIVVGLLDSIFYTLVSTKARRSGALQP